MGNFRNALNLGSLPKAQPNSLLGAYTPLDDWTIHQILT
jgi:hypothetical protein